MTTKKCSVDGCGSKHFARGFCAKHYKVFWRIGKPIADRECFHGTPEERFWHYTHKKGIDECWEWAGNKDKDGYGMMRAGKHMLRPHRFSYELHNGKVADGLFVLHSCNNPACVNPNHLRAGTQTDNMQDRIRSGNCPTGEKHPMAKVSDEQVLQILASNCIYKEIAMQFGISISQVQNIKLQRQRKLLDAV